MSNLIGQNNPINEWKCFIQLDADGIEKKCSHGLKLNPTDSYCSFHIGLSKAFWRKPFYYLFFRNENFMMCVNVFYITRNKICHDVTIVGYFRRGVYGEISYFCRIQLQFRFWVYKKCWHTPWKFQLEIIRSNKKVIAKKRLTN